MKLYHYSPSGNSCLKNGLCSVSLLPQFLFHYESRAKSSDNDKIIAWLDSTFSGRSRSIACFTESLKIDGKSINDNGDLFSFDIQEIYQDGLVESIYCKTRSGNGGYDEAFVKVELAEIDWTPFDFTPFNSTKEVTNTFFRHYFIVLKKGYIPAKYLTKES